MIPGLLVVFMIFSGQPEKEMAVRSRMELLVQKEWILAGYGYDKNGNGILEEGEDAILDCEKDNSCIFRRNGIASQFDNYFSCGDGVGEFHFPWRLVNNETAIDFLYSRAEIIRLTDHELVICEKGERSPCFLTFFRH